MAREVELPSGKEQAEELRKLGIEVAVSKKATKNRNASNKSREESVKITNKQLKALNDLLKAHENEIKTLKKLLAQAKATKEVEGSIALSRELQLKFQKEQDTQRLKGIETRKKQIKLSQDLLVKEQATIDVQKLKEKEDLKRFNIESQLKQQTIEDIELAKKRDAQKKKEIATSKKLTAQKVKTAQKLRLLIERSRAYGVELDDIEDGTKLVTKAMKGNGVAFQTLSRRMRRASKETKKFRQHTRNVHGTISVLRSKLLLASFAFGGITRLSSSFTNASRDQELAVKRVSNVIASQGFISGVTTKEVRDLASQLQNLTGVTDELTLESSSLLLYLILKGRSFLICVLNCSSCKISFKIF